MSSSVRGSGSGSSVTLTPSLHNRQNLKQQENESVVVDMFLNENHKFVNVFILRGSTSDKVLGQWLASMRVWPYLGLLLINEVINNNKRKLHIHSEVLLTTKHCS